MVVFTTELMLLDRLVSDEVVDVFVDVVVLAGFVAVVVVLTGARIADVVAFRNESP